MFDWCRPFYSHKYPTWTEIGYNLVNRREDGKSGVATQSMANAQSLRTPQENGPQSQMALSLPICVGHVSVIHTEQPFNASDGWQ